MEIECAYSFNDLFQSANLRKPTIEEMAHFQSLEQTEKNNVVKRWAKDAGWETKEKKGEKGILYIAFAPTFTVGKNTNDLSEYGITNC